ncbi:MAG TPA: ATP-binding cassette domain-containing protein, partial [Oscillospiraceae bacterium]|nr:ATP-binding cassette domain-containing protein [Oscillospiraceae bacterium]
MSILDVKNLVHTVGDKKLFNDASMSLFGGDKLGLTGLNGAGKSTFINILIGEIVPDSGMVKWNPKNKLGYLDQHARVKNEGITVRSHLTDAFSHLFKVQKKLTDITSQIAENLDSTDLDVLMEEMGELQMQLEIEDFYPLESEIDKTAEGLGLTAFGLDTPLSRLSGGQRAKVMLAKLLLEAPDVLLLDEPTNFLDREHIDWLAKYLQGFKGSFIVVSHDFSFLNRIVNCICDIEFGAIARYNGTYESFVNQKEQRHAQHIKNYESQQKEIAKLEDYVQRNIVRASTSKMAKSRRK